MILGIICRSWHFANTFKVYYRWIGRFVQYNFLKARIVADQFAGKSFSLILTLCLNKLC